jgi:putative nucleotidyltransferase with HDIG domain
MNIAEEIKKRILEIPMLSVVATRLLELTGDENHSLKDVVNIVENDPFLTARVLRIANSAAYSAGHSITSLNKAIIHLGEKMVAGVAIESCSTKVYGKALEGYESGPGELWDHSLQTAIAAREIAPYAHRGVSTDLAFTAGLLHDIGKSIISDLFKGVTGKMAGICKEKSADFLQAEREMVGTDHAEVGYELGLHWKLPEILCMAIRHHHKPDDCVDKYKGLVFVVHIADLVAMMGGSGTGADVLSYKIDENYEKYVTIGSDDLASIILNVQIDFIRTKKFVTGEKGGVA